MADGRQRNKRQGGGGGGHGGQGGGGGNQQRRRRGRNRPSEQHVPRGPVMTALGESTYEAVFDHGHEGYGVWFDGMVREDPMYRQHWKGHRPIFVKIDENEIRIMRELPGAGRDDEDDDDGGALSYDDAFGGDDFDDMTSNGAVVETPAGRGNAADAPKSGDDAGDEQGDGDEEEAPKPRRAPRARKPRAAAADDGDADASDDE